MKRKIQKLPNLDCFQEKIKTIYQIQSEEYDARSDDVEVYL